MNSVSVKRRTRTGKRIIAASVSIALLVPAMITTLSGPAQAAARSFASRFSKDFPGDVTFVANTLMTCPGSCAAVQNGLGINNNYAMVYVDADTDASTFDSSSSNLNMPAGSTVQWAGLYWGGYTAATSRNQVKFKVPGSTAYQSVSASTLDNLGSPYQGFLDVTSLVSTAGNGDYWMANVQSTPGAGNYAGWSLVVAYSSPGEKTRNCTVFDGMDTVNSASSPTINVAGFRTPPAGAVVTKLGVIAYEGDRGTTGDSLRLNNVLMSDTANASNDFFNSSITNSGVDVTAKSPNYLNQLGFDADILAVPNPGNTVIANGATSAQIKLTSTGDTYYPGVVTFCTDLYAPQIVSTKTGVDTTPLTPLLPGNEIEYTIDVKNTGQDPAIDTVINDQIPAWTTFVPGSLSIVSGPNTGSKTDGIDTDQAEVSGGTVKFRVGTSASATTGGTIPVQPTTDPPFTTVRFRVRLAANAPDGVSISNTAQIDYTGFTLKSASVAPSSSVVVPISNSADLKITKSNGVNSVLPGATVQYTIKVSNLSSSVGVTAAAVVDQVPVALTGVTWSCSATAGSSCASGAGAGSINSSVDLALSGVATYLVTGTLSASSTGSLSNSASVTSPGGSSDPDTTNNVATDTDPIVATGDLSITKTNGVTTVASGDVSVWTITAANAGPAAVVGAIVKDTFPASVVSATWTCAASIGASCPAATGSGPIAALVSLASAAQVVFTVTARTDTAASGTLTNTATIAAPAGFIDSITGNNTATDIDTYVPGVDLAVTKSHTPDPVIPGQPVVWTIRVDNQGVSTAPTASLVDNLPAGLLATAVSSAVWSCSIGNSGAKVLCSATNVKPGSSTILVTTDTLPSISSSISNSATVSSPLDLNTSNNTGTDVAAVSPLAGLSISKSHVPLTLLAGTNATWTIQVRNAGPSTATAVNVVDTLPPGTTLVSAVAPSGWTCIAATCSAASMDPASTATITIVGTISPSTAAGTITNKAVVSSALPDDPSDNTANDPATVVAEADLSIEKSRVGQLSAGESITYTITAINHGPASVIGALINDVLPIEILSPTWTCVGSAGGVCGSLSGMSNIATTVNLPVDAKVTFTVSGTASSSASGLVSNTATISAPPGITDSNAANNASTDTSNVAVRTALSIAKSNNAASVIPGTATTYVLVVRNAGPAAAAAAPVTDTLPSVISSASWTCTAVGGTCGAAVGSGSIASSVNLAVGGQATYVVVANVDPSAPYGTTISNSATVAAGSGGAVDPDLLDNVAVDTDPITPVADISIKKTDNLSVAVPGTSHQYTVEVQNAGPSTATGVGIADTLPSALMNATWTCVASSGSSCIANGTGNIATLATLAPGGKATYTVVSTIDPSARGSLNNQASVTLPVGVFDPTALDLSASDTTDLTPVVDLSVVKTASPNPAIPGQDISYLIVVSNVGPSTSLATVIKDAMPAGLGTINWTCAASGASVCTANGSDDISDTATVAAGQRVTYTVTAHIDPNATGSLTNVAVATAAAGAKELTPSNNTDRVIVALQPKVDVSLAKTGPTSVIAGEVVTWVITVSNAGPSDAPNTSVVDAIPSAIRNATWTCVASAGSTCGLSNGIGGISTTANLGASSKVTYTVSGTLDPWSTITSLANTATENVDAAVADVPGANDTATVTSTVQRIADLSITKSSVPTTVIPGTPTQYTVTVTNTGPTSVAGAHVVDVVPASLLNASWACAGSNGAACVGGGGGSGSIDTTVDVPAGGVVTFTVLASIDPWFASGIAADVVNTATVSGPSGIADPQGNNTATETDVAAPVADLVVTKSNASTSIIPGTNATYTITVSNHGPSAVRNVSVTDTMAAPFVVADAQWSCATIGDPPSSCSAVAGSGNINTTVDLAPNDVATFKVSVPIDAAATGSVNNSVLIAPDSRVTDPTPGDHSASDTDTLTPKVDLAVTKTDGTPDAIPGNGVTYTIVVTNLGPSDSPNTAVIDSLPSALRFATWTCNAVAPAHCDDTGGSGSISTTVDLPAGQSATLLMSATIDPASTGTVTNTVRANPNPTITELDDTNNQASDTDVLVPTADVSISKTNSTTTQTPGLSTIYDIVVTNHGPSSAPGVEVIDLLQAPLTGASWTCTATSSGSCTSASGIDNIDALVDLAPGASATFHLTSLLVASSTGTAVNSAQALMPSGLTDPITANNTATDTDTLIPAAELRVSKTHTPAVVVPGEAISYNIVVTNDGPSAAPGVVIDDPLSSMLKNATWACSGTGGASCSAPTGTGSPVLQANFPPHSKVTVTVDATVKQNAVGVLSNTVSASLPSTVVDPTPGTNPGVTSATDSATLVPTADLSVTKTDGSATAIPGETISYSIVARNNGPSYAPGVTVSDVMPSALIGASWTCVSTPGSLCAAPSGQGAISSKANLASGGNATYTLVARIDPLARGTLINNVSIGLPTGIVDPDSADRVASDNDTLIATAELLVTKSHAPTEIVPGLPVTYTITVSNEGPSSVPATHVVDPLPAALTNASWTCTAESGALCQTPSGTGSIDTHVDLAPHTTATFLLVAEVKADAISSLSNSIVATLPADVTDPTPDTTPGADIGSTTATDTTPLKPHAALSVLKSHAPTALIPGQTTTYTIVVKNAGPSFAPGVITNDSLPSAIVPTGPWTCVATAGSTCNGVLAAGSLAASSDIASGGSITYTLSALINSSATGSLSNSALITVPSGVVDAVVADNGSTDSDRLLPTADLNLTKTHSPATLVPGQSMSYQLTATNDGPSDIVGAHILDTLPIEVNNASWTCTQCVPSSGVGNIDTYVDLVHGNIAVVNVLATLDAGATGAVVNTAAALLPSGLDDPDTSNNIASDSATYVPKADITVTKTRLPAVPVPGSPVVYTITATNNGPSHAPGVHLVDALPASLLQATWSCVGSGTATCGQVSGSGSPDLQANLPAGTSVTVTVRARIDPDSRGVLSNSAHATVPFGLTETHSSDNSDTSSAPLVPTADVNVVKSHSPATLIPGQPVTYMVVVSNDGPSSVSSVQVNDSLPNDIVGAVWTCVSSPGSSCDNAVGLGSIDTSVDLLPAGSTTFVVNGTVKPASNGLLANTATIVLPVDIIDSTPNDHVSVDSTVLQPTTELSISKTDNQTSVIPGTATSYTIVVTNNGPSYAVGVSVLDSLPSALQNPTWTCIVSGDGSCGNATGIGSIASTVSLAPNAMATFIVNGVINPSAVGTLTNTASLVLPDGATDPNPSNNSASDSSVLTPTADISVVKTNGRADSAPGAPVSWTITATNNGPSFSPGTSITDSLPTSVLGASWSCHAAQACTISNGVGNVNTVVDLLPGQSATVDVQGTVDPATTGLLENTAVVASGSDLIDTDTTNNDSTDTDVLRPASGLRISKTHVGAVVAGQPVEWKIVVSNDGPSSAAGARVLDSLPNGVTDASWTCSVGEGNGQGNGQGNANGAAAASCANDSGVGSIDSYVTLPPNTSAVFRMRAKLDSTVVGFVENTARVLPPTGALDRDPVNNTSTDLAPVSRTADLSIEKRHVGESVYVSRPLTYIITAKNSGPSAVYGADISDALPNTLSDAVWTCAGLNGGSCHEASGGTVNREVRTLVDLPVGGSAVLTLTAIPGFGSAQVVNTATIHADGVTDLTTGDHQSTDRTTIIFEVPLVPPPADLPVSTTEPVAITVSPQQSEPPLTEKASTPTTQGASPLSAAPTKSTSFGVSAPPTTRDPFSSIRPERAERNNKDQPNNGTPLALTGSQIVGFLVIALWCLVLGTWMVRSARKRTDVK
jgi:uncharacterized repeat protein (TIGR01451 family)